MSDDIAVRFAITMDWLCKAVAARAGKDRALSPFLCLVWSRLRRAATRFDRLLAQWRSGTLPAPRPPRPRAAPMADPAEITDRPDRPPRRPAPTFPTGFAWLVKFVPEAAAFGGQLEHLLTDQEMQAFLAAAPQLGRILRPLCRMLGGRPGANLPPAPSRSPPRARPNPRPRPSRRPAPPTVRVKPAPPVRPAKPARMTRPLFYDL